MSFGDVATKTGGGGAQQGDAGLGPLSDRLSLGVAARLSRYLQVLTQARKMGKETISSQELSEYTHVNSTQIRRDLSGSASSASAASATTWTGWSSRSARSCARAASTTSRCSAPGTSAPRSPARTSSPTTASASSRSSTGPGQVGEKVGPRVRHPDELKAVVEDEDIVVGVLAVPTAAAQELADKLVEAGVKIIFNYSEALLQVPPEVTVHTSSPAVDLLYALYFYLT